MEQNVNNVGSARTVPRLRDPSPERRRTSCWSGIWRSRRRERAKRIAPASDSQELSIGRTPAWTSIPASASENPNQLSISLSLLAPPSSPASFANSRIPSSIQSPSSFTVSSSTTSDNMSSPGGITWDRTPTMFIIGPYAYETAIVTPPAFSAFTTAPSTAPFTPPPELAHLTKPPSPDSSFAKLLASSLRRKGAIDSCCTTSAVRQCSFLDHVDYHTSQISSDSIMDHLIFPSSVGFGSQSSSPYVGCNSPRLPDLYSQDSGFSQDLQRSQHNGGKLMHLELGFEAQFESIPKEHGASSPRESQDCDKTFSQSLQQREFWLCW